MFFWFIRIISWLPLKILFPTKVYGKKNLKKTKSIIVSTHQSNLDAVLMLINTNFVFYTMTKSELFKNRVSKWIFTHLHAIPVNRQTSDISAIKASLRVLNEKDKPLLIFPSGTREKEEENASNFKNGTSMIALKSNSSIIPVAFNKKPRLFRRTKIFIGKPIECEELLKFEGSANEKYSQITALLEENIANLKDQGENLCL